MKITLGKLAGLAALSLLLGTAARADSISFDLTQGNTSTLGSGPFGTVLVNRTSSTVATITFTANTADGYLFVDGGSAGVNVNASSWTLSAISGTTVGVGFVAPTYSDGGAGNEDGWGKFNQTINNFDSFKHAVGSIMFTLTDTSGTWASAADVLTDNAQGHSVAAHVAFTTVPLNQANGAIATGFATTGGGSHVPDGGTTAILLGLSLVGMSIVARRKIA